MVISDILFSKTFQSICLECFLCQCYKSTLIIVNFDSDNGLMPSGNKPSPKPLLTIDFWRHFASLDPNVLNIFMIISELRWPWADSCHSVYLGELGGRFKNNYELLNQRALICSCVNKIHIFQCMVKIFCVEFQRVSLKFHTKYLSHTLKVMIWYNVEILRAFRFKSSCAFLKCLHPPGLEASDVNACIACCAVWWALMFQKITSQVGALMWWTKLLLRVAHIYSWSLY